jgi:hypothetical protein
MFGLDQTQRGRLKKKLRSAELDKSDEGGQEIRKIDALLRFYLKIDPEDLSDEEWADRWAGLKYALEFERARNEIDLQ